MKNSKIILLLLPTILLSCMSFLLALKKNNHWIWFAAGAFITSVSAYDIIDKNINKENEDEDNEDE